MGQTSPQSSQVFGYDDDGRLTSTRDTVINGSTATCTTRAYALDADSNRNALASYPDDGSNTTSGHCSTSTTAVTTNSTFDAADRITNTGYGHDSLGRITTVPGVDAAGVGWAALAGTQTQAGVITLQFVNLHGDVVATDADSASSTGIDSYSESTEYGAPRTPTSGYRPWGYLGGHQRSTAQLGGTIAMGVRLYDPATARFLSTDPVPGGNENPYLYVTNPTDMFDLDGRKSVGGGRHSKEHDAKDLSPEEKEAIDNKEHGRPYDSKAYKRGKKKQEGEEKIVGKQRNKQRRDSNYSVSVDPAAVAAAARAAAAAAAVAAAAAAAYYIFLY